MAITLNGLIPLGIPRLGLGSVSVITPTALTNFVIDAADHAFAFKFIAQSTSGITHADVMLNCVGDTSGCTFTVSIQADNAGVPSGTVLGAGANAKATFAGPAATTAFVWAGGGTNPLELGESTGTLTKSGLYWVVVKETGTNPDAANYIQAYRDFGQCFFPHDSVKMDDGSNAWTHVTAITNSGYFIVKNAAGNIYGKCTQSVSAAMTGATHIFDNNRQGIKYSIGAQHYLYGVTIVPTKTSSPTDLNIKIYNGTTLLTTETFSAASITTIVFNFIALTTPQLIPADAVVYITFVQKGTDETDGGDGSNDYAINCATYHPTYYSSIKVDGNFTGLWGTSTDPTALTAIAENIIPLVIPMIYDTITGIDSDLPEIANVRDNDTVNGATGTMVTRTLSAANETVDAGYYAATTLSAEDTDLAAANIVTGKTIFGVAGSASAGGGAVVGPFEIEAFR